MRSVCSPVTILLIDLFPFRRDLLGRSGLLDGASLKDRVQMVSPGRVDVEPLRRRVDGQVMLPGEDGYDSARAMWNAMVDRRPAVVVRCASSADVAAAIDSHGATTWRSVFAAADTACWVSRCRLTGC